MSDMIVDALVECFKKGSKLLIAGNGGSAADSQHIAAEFLDRYKIDRLPLPAIALAADTPTMSAIANHFGYEQVFSRPFFALAPPGDLLLVLSTSGRSTNIKYVLWEARNRNVATIGFSGLTAPPEFQVECDYWRGFEGDTAAIQEGDRKDMQSGGGEVECLI